MARSLADLARKGAAVLVLLAAAWLLLKFVVGVVTAVAWVVVAVLAVAAVIWALRVL